MKSNRESLRLLPVNPGAARLRAAILALALAVPACSKEKPAPATPARPVAPPKSAPAAPPVEPPAATVTDPPAAAAATPVEPPAAPPASTAAQTPTAATPARPEAAAARTPATAPARSEARPVPATATVSTAAPESTSADHRTVLAPQDRNPADAQVPTIAVRGVKVTGVGEHADLGITAQAIQALADTEYANLSAAAGEGSMLSYAQLQRVADRIAERYQAAGFTQSQAYLPGQSVGDDKTVRIEVVEGLPPAPVVVAVPPLRDRPEADAPMPTVGVRGFTVTGVADHAELGITPAAMQALADAEYARLAADGGSPIKLSFAQMQAVADRITEVYKAAGFILARAFLPAQSIGADEKIRIDVLEGRLAKIIVKGNKRYSEATLSGPARPLRDKPLIKSEVETALLYIKDLPGVTVTSTFQPGAAPGDTDLLLLATEAKRPVEFRVGTNNFGNSFTGRYRAQAGLTWNNPLGFGDSFTGLFEYGYLPDNNLFGTANYRAPISIVRGLGILLGYSRNQLQINSGSLAPLGLNGPSSNYYGGFEWKFINTPDLKVTANLLGTYETSRLDSVVATFSDDRVGLVSATVVANRTDKRFKGVDVFELGVRKSVANDSLIAPGVSNDRQFLLGTLGYTRLQFLTKTQRLIVKARGQYTGDALIAIEQFALGGPESVRAYPIVDVLNDRGVYGALEYHVDAPGFADAVSPFYGRPWKEVLEFEVFGDYATAAAAGQHRGNGGNTLTRSGVGGGLIFRLPRFYQMQFHVSGAVPLSNAQASDGNDYHVYGQLGFSF
ncbi:POTRA domain-containing protein [Nevskia sp.]|uniref:POTRA domain-containing protein n=1 Tax=Nevskia sp. TaxID=1929292 RepID=UPI0025F121A0|nr:POTRA domain-containing protein [Nevskia sp.]